MNGVDKRIFAYVRFADVDLLHKSIFFTLTRLAFPEPSLLPGHALGYPADTLLSPTNTNRLTRNDTYPNHMGQDPVYYCFKIL